MIEKMNAAPVLARLNTSARMAKTMARNVEATAASCGLLPKGVATKNDQLASVRPSRRCTTMMTPTFVAVKMRKCHIMETMIHAGRYASETLRCQELHILINTLKGDDERKRTAYMIRAESRRPITLRCAVKRFARSPPNDPGSW